MTDIQLLDCNCDALRSATKAMNSLAFGPDGF